jgi:cytochrome b subunit of formate dehydrogenase
MLGFGQEPEADKYLPEQRLAYAYLAVVGLILVITGIFKVLKNLPGVYFSPGLVTAVTLIHTFGTIFFLLGIVAHVAALLFKVNRPMVKPIFTGKMNLGYARMRHPIWYEKLGGKSDAVEAPAAAGENQEEEKEKPAPGSVLEAGTGERMPSSAAGDRADGAAGAKEERKNI